MKENLKVAWIASWFALLGQLLIFTGVSLLTGNWRFVQWSFIVSMIVGVPNMINTYKKQKKADKNKLRVLKLICSSPTEKWNLR